MIVRIFTNLSNSMLAPMAAPAYYLQPLPYRP